ncbi:NAD-dependent epimerase/dehydratase family protein [Geminocystis sp.]|uniref:NAD-dependent epimerase/dehydratase family protein n=1 Tax=Geminocystis sp. TaxID=2664100 RepID=UPI00359459C7
MKNQRVLITGGAGLVGSHIADLLVKEEVAEIIILDDFTRGRKENIAHALAYGNITVVDGDIRDLKLLSKVMSGIDFVFHQAAIRITQCAQEPRLALEVLVDGTFNVLETAVKTGVKKVIAASSASVYGMADQFPTSEQHHPYNNETLYGTAKTFNEGLLKSFYQMYDLDYIALRYFNIYGPRMDIYGVYTEVLIRWMERIARGEPPLILGDGKQTMDFVYIEDIARANILAAQSLVTDEVFNIASGIEISLNDLAQTLLTVMGSTLTPEYAPPRKINSVQRRLADTTKAKEILNFKASISLEEGLNYLVKWWQKERLLTINN